MDAPQDPVSSTTQDILRALLRLSSISSFHNPSSMSQAELEQAQEAHWSSYHASAARDEESEIVAQFLTPYPYQNEQDQGHQEHWPDHAAHSNAFYWSQGDSHSGSNSNYFAPHSDIDDYYLHEPNVSLGINTLSTSIDLNLVEEGQRSKSIHLVPNPSFIDQMDYLNDDHEDSTVHSTLSHPKTKLLAEEEHVGSRKKKARVASAQVQKQAKKSGSKRSTQKSSDDGESNTACSDNDSNCSEENRGMEPPPVNANAKTRAGRGSATDPQSLYARKRRERINERLKILQNLVPNGTKVDISTMLEEAVQYVKFLQLQIKLLSSDELWMYAPIAYNGMNIGMDLKLSPPQ